MDIVTDARIVAALRRLYPLVAERDDLAQTVSHLREATSARELEERDRHGSRMAELDERILRATAAALDEIGLYDGARAIEWAMESATAHNPCAPTTVANGNNGRP
ncbi:hypothetical protein NDR87_33760 [Nocardia sp. CDC159]|uniref:Uncharacterized protein n=1 Tax=Nocardia pulmonis TaxID=2951408 RepID=A0A9X2J133_9NOCA|nr:MULTISPECIES: hypothetical protein [Nocardia]MCM6778464.1 hypothetical protein [Nocardia pulmonis]MCM6791353.1 hypothetical protein [Nocardia sp. CDC159]